MTSLIHGNSLFTIVEGNQQKYEDYDLNGINKKTEIVSNFPP